MSMKKWNLAALLSLATFAVAMSGCGTKQELGPEKGSDPVNTGGNNVLSGGTLPSEEENTVVKSKCEDFAGHWIVWNKVQHGEGRMIIMKDCKIEGDAYCNATGTLVVDEKSIVDEATKESRITANYIRDYNNLPNDPNIMRCFSGDKHTCTFTLTEKTGKKVIESVCEEDLEVKFTYTFQGAI